MRRTAFLIAIVLAVAVVPGAIAQSSPISGQILDQHGDPVVGAQVYLNQWQERYEESPPPEEHCSEDGYCTTTAYPQPVQYHSAEAVTDQDGRFSFEGIDGEAHISANKEGYSHAYLNTKVSGATSIALEMLRFPDKDAHIEGRVLAGGSPLKYVSINVENPVYGQYECSARFDDQPPRPVPVEEKPKEVQAEPAEPDSPPSESGDAMRVEPTSMSIAPGEWYPYPGCAITIHEDGTFSGNVTPGYSLIRVYGESWRDPDGVQYYPVSRVIDLKSGETTRVDFSLTAKPGPDATLKGYVLDGSTGEAVPGARISFNNQDSYGWANAQTDKDGSYKVAVRSGYTQVSVWADGFLPWEGQVVLAAGDDRRIDLTVTPGESIYGNCCIAYAEDAPMMARAEGDKGQTMAPVPPSAPAANSQGSSAEASAAGDDGANSFQDLGGGLGPYEPAGNDPAENVPGFEIVAVLLGLAAVVLLVRRK